MYIEPFGATVSKLIKTIPINQLLKGLTVAISEYFLSWGGQAGTGVMKEVSEADLDVLV